MAAVMCFMSVVCVVLGIVLHYLWGMVTGRMTATADAPGSQSDRILARLWNGFAAGVCGFLMVMLAGVIVFVYTFLASYLGSELGLWGWILGAADAAACLIGGWFLHPILTRKRAAAR